MFHASSHPLDTQIRVGILRPVLVEVLREFFGRSDMSGRNGESFIEEVEKTALIAAGEAQSSQPSQRPAFVAALRGLVASLHREPTEFELRAAAHELTVKADRIAAGRARREDSDA